MVRQGREREGGGVRVLLPPHHCAPGTFPRDICPLKVGLAACWGILRVSVLITRLLGEATALGVDAMHRLCEGRHCARSFPEELQRHNYHYCLCCRSP